MRVLLIEPLITHHGISVALSYLAGSLNKAGHEVKVYSAAAWMDYNEGHVERHYIDEFKPDLIGYSIYFTSYHAFLKSIGALRKWYKGPVVVGGPEANLEQGQLLQDVPELDYVAVGESEFTILELLEAISGDRELDTIQGIIYRKNGTITATPKRKPIRDLDSLPYPYLKAFGLKSCQHYRLITSRGCPFRCTFCFRGGHTVWSPRKPEELVKELKFAIETYGTREFVIGDDAFNIKPDRIIKFCDLLDEEGIRLPWHCTGGRADLMTDDMVRRMKETGCYLVNIGVESLQPDVFKTLNKGETLPQILEGLEVLKKHNITAHGFFMIGIPGDTPQGFMDTYKKAKTLGLATLGAPILVPFPDTAVYDNLKKNPNVKWLRDYRTISDGWSFSKEHSIINSTFELPEFTEKEKVHLYNKVRTMEGEPRPPYKGSLALFGLHAVWFLLKYDLPHAPKTLFPLSQNFLKRIWRSRGKSIARFVYEYEKNWLPTPQELRDRYKD